MCDMTHRDHSQARHGCPGLSADAAAHLEQAIERMDLLLAAPEVEEALGHLLAMLQHLRALRRIIA